ncbi:hypothetical protein [Xylophilus sp. ASV27]|uniref:hypothetical protein n=1 Tax=Xylophilus sp. ASV27 TaxID=2795129 RepID=UPI0018EC38FD|nr:hypothetical protein [Xylophilus sp. ASV27]
MLDSEKLAIAAHLHVLLRRITGRVTDTEWMAGNKEYAAAIVRFAREKADEEDRPELAEWAYKLERAMGLLPPAAPPAAPAPAAPPAPDGPDPRYVGRLR